MDFRMNLRIKVFIIAVVIIVLGQVGFSLKNVEKFQKSYIETLNTKYEKLALYLKSDVERVLSIGIPLTDLTRMEDTLHRILHSGPELKFIEITDNLGNVLYFADQNSMEKFERGERKSFLKKIETVKAIQNSELTPADTNVSVPILDPESDVRKGFINLHIAPEEILSKSNEVLLDMITVILTSLLVTFELLGFFVAYEVSSPLNRISQNIHYSIQNYTPMPLHSFVFMDELTTVVVRFNQHIHSLKHKLTPISTQKRYFPKIKKSIDSRAQKEQAFIEDLLKKEKSTAGSGTIGKKINKDNLGRISELLTRLQGQVQYYLQKLNSFASPGEGEAKAASLPRTINYEFIRPLVFLFIMADGFCLSFLPMYIDSLYQPLMGLPKEVVLALPISLFMLTLAVGMPLGGAVTDSLGWYKPLLFGILLNIAGHIFTGLSVNLYQLIIFRCLTGLGFALVYMSCQRFIMANTSVEKRAMGMSSFLAAFFSGDICGTVIGGMLVNRTGYSWVFFLSALFSFLTFLVAILIFKQYKESRESTQSSGYNITFLLKNIFSIFKDRKFCIVLFLQAIPAKMVVVGFLYYFVPLYLQSIGILQSNIGRIIICYGLALVFLGPLFSRYLGKEYLRKYNVLIGGIITGLSLLIFKMEPSSVMVVGIVLSIGIAHTFSISSQAALISETETLKKLGAGTGMGVFRFWERLGNIIGPLFVGYFISKQNYTFSMVVLGTIILALSLLYLLFVIYGRGDKHG